MTANKKETLFNSRFETSLRVLLLLSEATVWPLSSSTISNIDFMATYGQEFGVSNSDLHGKNKYMFSQLAAKKKLIDEALKKLVRLNLVKATTTDGFKYMITDAGVDLIGEMDNTYSDLYRNAVSVVFANYDVNHPENLDRALKNAKARKGNDNHVFNRTGPSNK